MIVHKIKTEIENSSSIIKPVSLSEINNEQDLEEVLKGNNCIRKITTTEYFIVENDGKNNKYILGADPYDDNSESNGSLHFRDGVFIPNKIPLPKEPRPISTLYESNKPVKRI